MKKTRHGLWNHRLYSNGKSKYKGVYYDKITSKWRVEIDKDYKRFKIGRFTNEEKAAIEYNKKAQELFGEYAYLNIIDPKISFCLITTKESSHNLKLVIDSIYGMKIPSDSYEIIVVGGNEICSDKITYIPFDESIKPGWVTRKKNLANSIAKFANVVNSHDYFTYDHNWYNEFVEFNKKEPSWEIMMVKIHNLDGSRYRDWCVWGKPGFGNAWIQNEKPWCPPEGLLVKGGVYLAPYSFKETQYMYISGGWQLTRKYIMEENPWNEDVLWGSADDCEWCLRTLQSVPQKYNYVMNEQSIIKLCKQKDVVLMRRDDLV